MSSARNNPAQVEIVCATEGRDIAAAGELFREYAASLSIGLCFQNFEHELATLPGGYAAPRGCLLLARVTQQNAGCIGLRAMEGGVGEIKRLYVRPEFRRRGLGRMLIQRALVEARDIGYDVVRLDTLREMSGAIALYTELGFKDVAPYRQGEPEGICYFELKLSRN
jgi:ribosomal protein S18 acetylase RimI-like enzyme